MEVAPTTSECLSPILNEDDSVRQSNGKDAISGGSDGSVEERGTRYPLHFTKGSLIQVGAFCMIGFIMVHVRVLKYTHSKMSNQFYSSCLTAT